MKLHLPNMLRAALLAAVAAGVTSNAYADDTKLELYPCLEPTRTEDNLTVSGTDRVGYIDDNGNLYTAFNNDTRTQNLTVTGDLTIEGNGHVAVGGGNADGGSAAYLKVANGTLTVKDNAQLDALGCEIKNLDIKGGTVRLDTTSTNYCGSGNSSYSSGSNKQATITNSLTISGGELYMGTYNGAYVTKGLTSYHCSAGFKGSINQTGGLMSVRTDAAFNGAVTINQTGTAESDMYFTEQMEIGTSLTINQSNDNATLGLGRLTKASTFSSVSVVVNQSGKGTIKMTQGAHFGKGSTVKVNQTGDGTIDVCDWYTTEELKEADRQDWRESVRKPYTNQNATYTLEQSGKGTINIATAATINADSTTVGNGAKLNVQGKLTTEELTLASGAMLDNTGTLTVGTGTAGQAGELNVTTGGTLNVVLDGDAAAINVGTSAANTDTVTDWKMSSGSTFGIGFTKDYFKNTLLNTSESGADDTKIITFSNVLVANVANGATGDATKVGTAFGCTYGVGDVAGIDARHWTVGTGTALSNDASGDVVLSGTLIYNPWIELTEGGVVSEAVTDPNKDTNNEDKNLTTGLDISGNNITLSGDNSHTLGTKINGVEVTLGHENALGNGPVTTKGTSSLIAANGVTAKLPGTIDNTGDLTLKGSFKADNIGAYTGAVGELYVDADNNEGTDGFKREGVIYQIVENGQGATLTVGDGTTVQVGTDELKLFTDGIAGTLDYDTYYMISGADASSGAILKASGVDTVVDMAATAGTLTADESIEVNAKGGTVKLQEETAGPVTVSGCLENTTVESAGGTISADITGTSSVAVTGDTTLSGTNSYSGDTVIDGAELKLASGSSVGTGVVELKSHGTFDMGGNALDNFIKVTGCTLRGAGSYAGDMEVHDELELADATTANKVTLVDAGSLTGSDLTVNELDVQTNGDASVGGSLTINDNGTITLNNGKVLSVGGSLTLAGATTLTLNGNYAVGTELLSSTGTLTMDLEAVTLVYDDSTVELEQQGNALVLVSKFKQDKADVAAQSNWGIATTSRAFVNTVRGQHSNTGCIANGRGTVWAAAFGAYNDLDGSDIDVKGAAVGVDAKVGSCSTVGIAFGYAEGEVSPTGLRDADQEGEYVALYGSHGLKKLSSTSCLSLDWVAAYGNTESEWNSLKWEQDSLQLNTRLNWNKKVTERLGMSVFGGLEYFATGSDTTDGVKSGSIQNLRGEIGVGARYVAWGTPASQPVLDEKGATLAAARPGCEKLVLNGEIRYFNDMVRSNPVIEMDGLRGGGENPGRQGMGIEAGATYRISERWSASANYSFNAMEDSVEHRANVGASYTF